MELCKGPDHDTNEQRRERLFVLTFEDPVSAAAVAVSVQDVTNGEHQAVMT